MEVLNALPKQRVEEGERKETSFGTPEFELGYAAYLVYVLAIAATISTWFLAIRAPLWIDETGTFWQINAGGSEIWARHFLTLSSPEHAYILWLSTKLIGTSEVALRLPSTLAMLGAVYVLYLAARELFERDIALIAVVLFSLHPVIAFESIDARPYAFGALLVNTTILILLRLRHNDSNWGAALFGVAAACTVWFQDLFIVILPALLVCFFLIKNCGRKVLWKQFCIAFLSFGVAFLPALPLMLFLFRTSRTHVVEPAPNIVELLHFLAPGWLFVGLCVTGFVAFLARAVRQQQYWLSRFVPSHLLICASLAIIPTLILYSVSVGTSVHPFLPPRHCLDAIPGITLSWAFALSRFRSRVLRLLFCAILVVVTVFTRFSSPAARLHNPSWRDALQYAEKNASADGAPAIICSEFPESDFVPMPVDSPKTSKLFSPLSYYKLSVPVVPMPRELNAEAMGVGSAFLQEAAKKHERFLVLARNSSAETLAWLARNAASSHSVHKLAELDGVVILEFAPRAKLP